MPKRGASVPILSVGVLLACVVVTGCATTQAPANLDPHKQEIRAYVTSGAYLRQVDAVALRAQRWVEARAAQGGVKLTVVFDLDETLFFNWPHLNAMDFGYVESEWNRWVSEGRAPAIESIRDVYRAARRLNVDVVFITGRRESQRAGTELNLRVIDCADYAELICKGSEQRGTAAEFKTAQRKRLVTEGRTIIANIGDQDSDLAGGYSERIFKLPNVIYLTE